MEIVLDTNVLVSAAIFPNSKPGLTYKIVFNNHVLLHSLDLAAELEKTLLSKKMRKYIKQKDAVAFLSNFKGKSKLVVITSSVHESRDPKDNHILELAIDGNADLIVSGDRDLLELNPFQNIPIISPSEFLDRHS
ncbi:MAG: putative toxin-antitoxin system toxin component, PIN family [Cyclobacteriaceae bacterium]